MKKLAIIGSGDLGQLISYHSVEDKKFDVVGYFDDYKMQGVDKESNIHILGSTDRIIDEYKNGLFDCIIIAIGYKHFEQRKNFFSKFYNTIPFATFIHSSCFVDSSCIIGEGSVLLPGVVCDRNVKVGANVLINVGTCIAHDSSIGQHSFLSPRVAIAGFSAIGECCNIGINTTIIDNVTIGDNIQTGGGTVVNKNLSQSGLYVGNPARFIR